MVRRKMNGTNIVLIYLRRVISGLFSQCRLNGGNRLKSPEITHLVPKEREKERERERERECVKLIFQ